LEGSRGRGQFTNAVGCIVYIEERAGAASDASVAKTNGDGDDDVKLQGFGAPEASVARVRRSPSEGEDTEAALAQPVVRNIYMTDYRKNGTGSEAEGESDNQAFVLESRWS
jgi:hypothetical protein